jgi:hypothetical protein
MAKDKKHKTMTNTMRTKSRIRLEEPANPAYFQRRRASIRRLLEAPGLTVTLAILLPACSTTPKVQTQAKPGTDCYRYRIFALMPLPPSATK